MEREWADWYVKSLFLNKKEKKTKQDYIETMIQHCPFHCFGYPQSSFMVHVFFAKETADNIVLICLCSNISNK